MRTEDPVFAAYLRRLGLDARPAPDAPALADLMGRHLERVPFENLDIVGGTPRPLSTSSVLQKVAMEGRGGFCYELNEAFRALLAHLGFRVRRIEARVWKAAAQCFGAPFDHLALVVSLAEGEFLVDVGYGDSNRAPLRLPQDHVRDVSGEYGLSPVREGYWCLTSPTEALYEMTLGAQPLEAFEPMCRYHQTSPESVFSKGLICTRTTATGRITLSRNRLIVLENGRRSESVVTDIGDALDEHFGIRGVIIASC
jgi:N-hydroxyarylamine O-acetyltransferase